MDAPDAELAVTLEGQAVALGRTSAGLATRAVDTFRRGLQSLVEALEKGKTADTATRHDRWIERLCDLPLVGVTGPGVRVLLARPPTGTLFTDDDRRLFDAAVDALFDGLEWADPSVVSPAGFSSRPPATRQAVLSVVLRLLPPRSGPVERVVFAHTPNAARPRRATLTREARAAVRAELAALTAGRATAEAEGVIRAVDLDGRTFVLSGRPGNQPDLPCTYHERTEGAVKALLDRRVVVAGRLDTSRARKVTLEAVTIEALAAGDAAAG